MNRSLLYIGTTDKRNKNRSAKNSETPVPVILNSQMSLEQMSFTMVYGCSKRDSVRLSWRSTVQYMPGLYTAAAHIRRLYPARNTDVFAQASTTAAQ